MKIENIDLSVRAYNCLKKAGINTINEMAMADLHKIRNCGKNSINEIKNKIIELKDKGLYSDEIVKKYIDHNEMNYVDRLPLSNRSKRILNSISIMNSNQLLSLDENSLYRVRHSGKTSVNEIMNYINKNRDKLIKESSLSVENNYTINIENYNNFSGETNLDVIPISSQLLKELQCNNLNTLGDLIINKINVSSFNLPEYHKVYNYFHKLACETFVIRYQNSLNNCYINIPFGLKDYHPNDFVKISTLTNYVIEQFNDFTIEEMINIKLYMRWLNTFNYENIENYFFELLGLSDKQEEIIGKRLYMTLEEIGQKFGVTRERIRQIEARTSKKIAKKLKNFPFKFLDLEKIYYLENLNNRELFLLYLDDKYDHNFIRIKENNKDIFIPSYHYNKITLLLKENKTELENNGFIVYPDHKYEDVLKYTLKYMNLNYHNDKISLKNTKRLQVKYAMRYLNRAINLSTESDLDDVIKTVEELYGTKLEKSRGLESLIQDAGVRIDSGTYAADDKIIPLDLKTLNEIVEYVKTREIINARDLFINFGHILQEHNLNNEVILYRYLKEELSSKLFFHGVSAVISYSPDLSCWGDVVKRDIMITNKPINKLDFMVKYSITEAVYQNLSINFDDIITWSSKELYLKSKLVFPEPLKREFINYLDENQITSFENIKDYLLNKDSHFLEINNIVTNVNLYYFLLEKLEDMFIIDKEKEEVRKKRNKNRIIEETYASTEELTL